MFTPYMSPTRLFDVTYLNTENYMYFSNIQIWRGGKKRSTYGPSYFSGQKGKQTFIFFLGILLDTVSKLARQPNPAEHVCMYAKEIFWHAWITDKCEITLKVLATIPYFNFHFFPHLLIFLQFRDPSCVLNLSTKAVLQKWQN